MMHYFWSLRKSLAGLSISLDARLIILARTLRTFGYGFTSVLLGVMMVDMGFTAFQTGVLLVVSAVGSIVYSLVMGLYADRLGRRRVLIITAFLMMGTGYVFASTQSYPLLLLAAFFGTISPSTNDNTPFSPIEQAILAQSETTNHTMLFVIYNLTAQLAGAFGGLAVGLPTLLSYVGINVFLGMHFLFVLYGLLAGSTALLFLLLSPAVELQPSTRRTTSYFTGLEQERGARPFFLFLKVHPNVLKLAGLFALDAFSGSLVVQTVLAVWFRERFGVSLDMLAMLFFGVNLLAALSLLLANRLAERFGLLKTMIIPHVLSNAFLLLVPCMPLFSLSAACLLMRQSLSKIDVPARQVYTVSLVAPEERTVATSLTAMARNVAITVSPLVSTLVLSGPLIMVGIPLFLAGCIGIGYDVTLWRVFRKVPLRTSSEKRKAFVNRFLSLHFPKGTAWTAALPPENF